MKKIHTLLAILVICWNSSFAQNNEYYFRFNEKDKNVINTSLTKIISIDNVKDGVVWAYANDKELKEFEKLGYKYEILPAPSSMTKVITMATTVAQMANWDRYPTYGVYRQMMKNFETNYPTLCKLDSICNLASGRKIYTLKISDNVNTAENEPEYMFNSTMHGDETAGFIFMLRLANYLLTNYGSVPRVQNIVNNIELYILPNINPDGTYYGGNNTVANARRFNANGVDINRDFPDPRTGPNNPPYEPETQAMIDFATTHHIIMGGSFHGGAEVMNYPWDTWTGGPPDNHKHADDIWCRQVCVNYVTTARTVSSGYMTSVTSSGVTNGGDWYVVNGGIQDYYTYFHNSRLITMEVSNTKLLGCENLVNYWNINQNSLLGFLEECLYGIRGTVKNVSTNPLNATVTIVPRDVDNSWVVTDPVVGDYHRLLEPGTYNVTYASLGYISQTHSVNVASYGATTIKDVILLQAQQTNVTGTVKDAVSGLPIQGVSIQILNSSYPIATTNASGQYTISSVFEGSYTMQASKTGYITSTQTVNITVSNNVINFTLTLSDPEGFETGLPACWVNSAGNLAWTQVNILPHSGTYCMKSGGFNVNNANSSLQITLNVSGAGNINFWNKVSSESGYDFLKFYIDGVEKGSWSGTLAWTEQSYPVTAGSHVFKWSYIKDGSINSGSDCAWIDDIIFPSSVQTITFNVKDSGNNPIQGANVNFNGSNQTTNSSGVAVFTGVARGAYKPYSVTISGYNTSNGNVTVNYCDATVTVTLTTLGINEVNPVYSLSLFPNPVNNTLILKSDNKILKVVFFDVVGSEIMSDIYNSNKVQISTSALPSGIYFIQIRTEKGIYNRKITKE
jgi:hypothetical protein